MGDPFGGEVQASVVAALTEINRWIEYERIRDRAVEQRFECGNAARTEEESSGIGQGWLLFEVAAPKSEYNSVK